MQLGYVDRIEKITIHILPRRRKTNLFDRSETTTEYTSRFFTSIQGLGNVELVKLQNGRQRAIAMRGY